MINPIKQFITLEGVDFFEDADVTFTYNENYGSIFPYSKSEEFKGKILFPIVPKQNVVLLCSEKITRWKASVPLNMFSMPFNLHPVALLYPTSIGGNLQHNIKLKVEKTTDIPDNYISFIHNINPVKVVNNKKELLLSYVVSNFTTCCGSRLIYIRGVNHTNINKQDYTVQDLLYYLFLSKCSPFYNSARKSFYNLTIFIPKKFNLDISFGNFVQFSETVDTILYINKQSKND